MADWLAVRYWNQNCDWLRPRLQHLHHDLLHVLCLLHFELPYSECFLHLPSIFGDNCPKYIFICPCNIFPPSRSTVHYDGIQHLMMRWPLVEDSHWWKIIFDGKLSLMENGLQLNIISNMRYPFMEDLLWWKTTTRNFTLCNTKKDWKPSY